MKKRLTLLTIPFLMAQDPISFTGESEPFELDGIAPVIEWLSPQSDEYFDSGETILVNWNAFDESFPVAPIEINLLSTAGEILTQWGNIENTGSIDLTLPDLNFTNAKFTIAATDSYGNTSTDDAEGDIHIGFVEPISFSGESNAFVLDGVAPNAMLISPNGGEAYIVGEIVPVSWSASDDSPENGEVTLYISTNAGQNYELVEQGLSFSGSTNTITPDIITENASFQIQVTDYFGNTATDESDNTFSIIPIPDIIFNALSGSFILDSIDPLVNWLFPNGGEVLQANWPVAVSWSASDDSFADTPIEISWSASDIGIANELLASDVENSGTLIITMPDVSSDGVYFHIQAVDDFGNANSDDSDEPSAIHYFACTDPEACNYDDTANVDDGNCLYNDVCGVCDGDNSSCTGCMEGNACNYNPDAAEDDGSCTYVEENYDCEGNCLEIIDCGGNCGGEDISCYQIEAGLVGKWAIGETVENSECEGDDNAEDDGPPETLIFNSDGTAEFFMSNGESMIVDWGVNDSTQLCFSGLNSDDDYDDGPDECMWDCPGIQELGSEDEPPLPSEFCPWLVETWGEAGDDVCFDDCTEDVYTELSIFSSVCEVCVEMNICDEGFDDGGDNEVDCSNCDCGGDPQDCWVSEGGDCCSEGDDGPPDCLLDCEGIDGINPEEDAAAFCDWLSGVWEEDDCISDCAGEEYMELLMASSICGACLAMNNCDEYFNDDNETDCSNCFCGGDPQACWESEGGECCSASGSGDGGIECVGTLEIIIPAVRAQVMEECGTTSLTGIYSIPLQEGPNLVSFWALPEDHSLDSMFASLAGNITGIIGQGTAALPNDVVGWVGSLNEISTLSGYWIMVNEPVWFDIVTTELTPLNTTYDITAGNNLVSWPSRNSCSVGDAIPDEFENDICGIIGQGVAAIPSETFDWVGSLNSFQGGKGYWLCSEIDMYFNWDAENCEGILSRKVEQSATIPDGYVYRQSTTQAFYFIESVENIETGDWILAYNGDEVIGAREWTGIIIDVPAMGNDGSDYTKGYMEAGSVPSFKILRGDELINLEGDIPAWGNNQLYLVSSLTEAMSLPKSFSLDRAYPNPFNPTTRLSFALPVISNVLLEVYDINGRLINELIKRNIDAGYHSVVWNADSQASGVYFVKMLARPSAGGVAGEYIHTQKLMLIK